MSTDDDGGLFNFNPDELPAEDFGDPAPGGGSGGTPGEDVSAGAQPREDASAGAQPDDEADTRGEDEHEVGGGHSGMGKGPTGS